MKFGPINWVNAAAVTYLVLLNLFVAKKGLADQFCSRHLAVNILEQVGRYGCMALMVLPVLARGWKFGFASVFGLLVWLGATTLLLAVYTLLWAKKAQGGAGVLYGLATVPTALFLLNGILLGHPMLIAAVAIFGVFHLMIVWENV